MGIEFIPKGTFVKMKNGHLHSAGEDKILLDDDLNKLYKDIFGEDYNATISK